MTGEFTINGRTGWQHAVAYANAIVRYATHKSSCSGIAETCSCGFQQVYDQAKALLAALDQVTK